jgi:hypothetical protein
MIPVFIGMFGCRRAADRAGIVDQNVDRVASRSSFSIKRCKRRGRKSRIGKAETTTGCHDILFHLAAFVLEPRADADYVRAGLGEAALAIARRSRGAAGYQSGLAVESDRRP